MLARKKRKKAALAAGRKINQTKNPERIKRDPLRHPSVPATQQELYERHLRKVEEREAIGIHRNNGFVSSRTPKLNHMRIEKTQTTKRKYCPANNFHGNDILRLAAMIEYPVWAKEDA